MGTHALRLANTCAPPVDMPGKVCVVNCVVRIVGGRPTKLHAFSVRSQEDWCLVLLDFNRLELRESGGRVAAKRQEVDG